MASVVIDSNLLILLVVGSTDVGLIERHKNVNAYNDEAFYLLVETLAEYEKVILTPNTLTETSNLLRQIAEPDRGRISSTLADLIISRKERYVVSREAVFQSDYTRLGLTDAALLIASRKHVLLSADNDLYRTALRHRIKAINFAHLFDQTI